MGKGKKTELAKMARIGKTRMKFLVCAWREKIEGDKNRERESCAFYQRVAKGYLRNTRDTHK